MKGATTRSAGTREAILFAAAGEFAVNGYAGTTYANILKALGKSTPNYISYHFSAKSDIAEAVLSRQEELWSTCSQWLANEGIEGIEALLTTVFIIIGDRKNRSIFQAAMVLQTDRTAPRPVDVQPCAAWMDFTDRYLQQARLQHQIRESIDTEHEAWMLVSTLYGTYELAFQLNAMDELADRVETAWAQILSEITFENVDKLIRRARNRANTYLED